MQETQLKAAPKIYICGIIENGQAKKLSEQERDDLKNSACSNMQDKNIIVICTDELPPLLRF